MGPFDIIDNIGKSILRKIKGGWVEILAGGGSVVAWKRGGFADFYTQQFQFNYFIIMMSKSPSKQTIKMDVKTSIGLLLHADTSHLPQHSTNHQQRIIKLPKDAVQKEFEIFSWRFKTFLPIVKPADYRLNLNSNFAGGFQQTRHQPSQLQKPVCTPAKFSGSNRNCESLGNPFQKEECEVAVKMEEIRCRLSDLDLLPLSQIIYLLKEMMIGYDALIDIFGIFGPTENMVAVSNNQWKVWINEDFFQNQKSQTNMATGERDFIYRVLMLAQKHCQCTNISKTFFNDLKEFTYSNQCGFISMIDKIKDFAKANKIFQVNKVTLPQDRSERTFNPEIPPLNFSINQSINNNKKPGSNFRLEKKLSFQPNPGVQQLTSNGMKTSNFNVPSRTGNNVSQIVSRPNPLQHVQSQKAINHSSFFYYPPQNPFSSVSSPVATNNSNNLKGFTDVSDSWNHFSKIMKPTSHLQMPNKTSDLHDQTEHRTYLSPEIIPKNSSPPRKLNKNSSFANISKSRHELKLLVNKNKIEEPQLHRLHPNPLEPRKNQRKYSEDIFKPKSVDALAAGMKKISGSNIYEQDPEVKAKGVNVIKAKNHLNSNMSPQKGKDYPSSNNTQQKSSTLKGHGSTTPNHSSNSTNQMHHSGENDNRKGTSYQYLKQNDLNNNKIIRNNQSSYYGMGGYPDQHKKDVKNMTISYQFKNRNENQSKSSASSNNKNQEHGNNWTKKISGLFSDDASIKHLKGSVKFKTADEERFEKEYLKDVKLDLLEKFGRPVRHSIVDEEDDDFRPSSKNPYKSMQLIEEVIDEGKSYMQKQEEIHEEDEPIQVRGRNKTMQVRKPSQEENIYQNIKERQCFSFECSEGSDSEGGDFNFQPEAYVLNRR